MTLTGLSRDSLEMQSMLLCRLFIMSLLTKIFSNITISSRIWLTIWRIYRLLSKLHLCKIQKQLFRIGYVLAIIVFTASFIFIIYDLKRQVILMRNTGSCELPIQQIGKIEETALFPGKYIINCVVGFLIFCLVFTLFFTIICHPLFWKLIWENRIFLLAFIIPKIIQIIIKLIAKKVVFISNLRVMRYTK